MLFLEQTLNGLQLGVTLFLLASGLTLTFGIMGVINLAHGSLFMIGAYASAYAAGKGASLPVALLAGLGAAGIVGVILEHSIIRRLYARDHLDQVLATFGLILFFNQAIILLVGRQPLYVQLPEALSGAVQLGPGLNFPVYRLTIIAVGLAVALALSLVVTRTRLGMLVRAASTNRDMVRALGVKVPLLYTAVFTLGAILAGLGGIMVSPLLAVQVGMGEQILITTFVVVIVGGVGSVRGAFYGGLVVGIFDTFLRAYAPGFLRYVFVGPEADALGAGLASMGVYVLMVIVLLVRPRGLFPVDA